MKSRFGSRMTIRRQSGSTSSRVRSEYFTRKPSSSNIAVKSEYGLSESAGDVPIGSPWPVVKTTTGCSTPASCKNARRNRRSPLKPIVLPSEVVKNAVSAYTSGREPVSPSSSAYVLSIITFVDCHALPEVSCLYFSNCAGNL